jgi:peptidylprolyl isomerase
MAQVKEGDTVKVHYTGKLDNGDVFDSSVNKNPLEFTTGKKNVIPGFEQAILGMSPGESKTIKVESDNAFGAYQKDLHLEIEKNKLPADLKLEVGQQLQNTQTDGQKRVFTITSISEVSVMLDANHPLAGKDLTFEIELVGIV